MAPSSKLAPTHFSATCWERGEPSRVYLEQAATLSPPEWQISRRKHWWRKAAPLPQDEDTTKTAKMLRTSSSTAAKINSISNRFAGRCFRCLATDHRVTQCCDPLRCLKCGGPGHISRSCPSRSHRSISNELCSRLVFPLENIHSRIAFPPLPPKPASSTNPQQILPARPKSTSFATELEHVPGHAVNRPMRNGVIIVASEIMTQEANRLKLHAVTVAAPPDGFHVGTLEVAYALCQQLHVPRHNISVSRLRPGHFLVDFKMSSERDHALCKQYIEIGKSVFPLRPWRSAGGGAERTWWYHVKVVTEDVPLEAWNVDGVRSILGDACIVDRLDDRSRDPDRESSEFLSCWVWMEDPDDLPRSVEYSIFTAGADQASDINGLPSMPPMGKTAEKVILVHLARYEDWSPKTTRGRPPKLPLRGGAPP